MLGHQNFRSWPNQEEYSAESAGLQQQNLKVSCFSILESEQGYVSVDSPTLTTTSGKSEITEAYVDFSFLAESNQPLVRGQQLGIPEHHPMQQPGFNDIHFWGQHIMFKQLQEVQRQQQLQQLGHERQHNSIDDFCAITKEAAGVQFSPLVNGTPVRDGSRMIRNSMQYDASLPTQGVSSRLAFPQEQGRSPHSMALVPQQQDETLYGTPITSAGGNKNQYSHLQGMPQDFSELLTKASGNKFQKQTQPSSFSNPFLGDRYIVPPDQVCMPQGNFLSKQGFPMNNVFGQVPVQGLSSGVILGNFQQGNSLQTCASVTETNRRQEEDNWPGTVHQKTTELGPAQGVVPLDPLEEKILYNTDDNMWDTSFGQHTETGSGCFGSTLEHADTTALPCIKSGSWSALMQSAVAEASSSDTGIQEEWSSLTFQNTELSTDNLPSNFMDSEKQQTGWVENNLQSASSFTSKSHPMFNDSRMRSVLNGFQKSGIQYSNEKREDLRQDDFHESIQNSGRYAAEWLHIDPQQNSSTKGSQGNQPVMHFENARSDHNNEHSESDARDTNEAMYKGRHPDGFMWKADRSNAVNSLSRSNEGLEKLHSGTDNMKHNKEYLQIGAFAAVPSLRPAEAHQDASQPVSNCNQPDYTRQLEVSMIEQNKNTGRNNIFRNIFEGSGELYNKQQNCDRREKANDTNKFNRLSGDQQGHFGQFKFIDNNSNDRMNLVKGPVPSFLNNSKASSEMPPLVNLGSAVSATFDQSNIPNATGHSSPNMLELLHKVDQSREDRTMTEFGSNDYNSLAKVPEPETPDASVQFYNQSSASQAFGLKLAPPSQRMANSNHFLSSRVPTQTVNLSSRQFNTESGERSQSWLPSPSSVQSSPSSNELSHRAHCDNRTSASGQTGVPFYMEVSGNSVKDITSSPLYARNQLQTQRIPNAPVEFQTSQATFTGTVGRYPPINLTSSEETPYQMSANLLGQQFPVLEIMSVSKPSAISGMSRQDGCSERPQNVWTNVPTQRFPSPAETHKVSSMDPSKKCMRITSWASQGLNDQNSQKDGYPYSELGSSGESGKDRTQQILSKVLDASQTGGLSQDREYVAKQISDADAFASSSLMVHSLRQDLDTVLNGDNYAPDVSEKNLESFGCPLKTLRDSHQNLSLQNLVQAKDVEIDKSKRVVNGANGLADVQEVSAMVGQQSIYEYNSMLGSAIENKMNSVSEHNSFPSAETKILSFLNEPTEPTSSLMESEKVSAPYVLPSGVPDPSMTSTKPRKRKTMIREVVPWHKQVTQGSQRIESISMAGEEWSQATNSLIRKVEGEDETIEGQLMLRPKKRLIVATQLMQQLLPPAPASILSADASSHYDSVTYIVARLALGDASSLICYPINDKSVAAENGDGISEKLKDFERIVESFSDRARKLENDFPRLDKAASIVDIRVECHDIERFSIINRFAKFHIRRGLADTSGTAMAALKLFPQRYVTAFPMPSNIPDGEQCVSL